MVQKSRVVVERRGNPGVAERRGNPGVAERRGNPGVVERRGNPGVVERRGSRCLAASPPAVVADERQESQSLLAVAVAFPAVTGGLLSAPALQHPAAGARISAQLYLRDVARILALEPALMRLLQGFAQSAAWGWERPPGQRPVTAVGDNDNPVGQQPY